MGTGSLAHREKRPRRGVDQPLHLEPRLKKGRTIPPCPVWAFTAFLE